MLMRPVSEIVSIPASHILKDAEIQFRKELQELFDT